MGVTKKTKKRSNNVPWLSRPARWMAVGTLAASTTLGNKKAVPIFARQIRGAPQVAPSQTHGLLVRRFDILPGLLETVLPAFQEATGLRIVVPNEGIRSLQSPGVPGVYTDEQALERILAGTGVRYRFAGDGVVTLELVAQQQVVEVRAQAVVVPSPKYPQPLLETPQSISVIPNRVMQEQGITTLRDALRNIAGISLAAGEGGAQGDNLTIRGFTARNDIFMDGMRDHGSYYRDPFNLSEVEVLQGPSSVTFGRGTTGGVVNQASKSPRLDRSIAGTANFGSDLTKRVTLDIDRPLPPLGTGAAFRLNFVGDAGGVAGRDIAEDRRFGIAPSLALGLGTPTRLGLSYFHQTANDIPDYGIPWLFNAPALVPRHNYYGFAGGNFLRTYVDIGTAKVEHDISSSLTLRSQVRYSHYIRDAQISEAQIASGVTPQTPLADITVGRHQIVVNSLETFLEDQTDLTARFRTGSVRHTLVTGVEAGRETSNPTRPNIVGVPVTSLLNPDLYQPFSGTSTITSNVHTTATSYAAHAIDTLALGQKIALTGGVRWDRFGANYNQSISPTLAFSRVDEQPTYRAALVYKPRSGGSIYFDYGTSFNPSAESLSLSAATANLPPEKNRTFEVGSKWELGAGQSSLRTAIFRTEKTNAREPDPANPLLNVLSGNQQVDGFEVEGRGSLTRHLKLMSSYALLASKLVASRYYPAAVGARLANVPENTFTSWTTYDSPWKLEIGAGAQYVGSRTASSTMPFDATTHLVKQVPGYWLFSAMAKYPIAERLDLQLNLYNLTNKYYYDEIHPAHIIVGAGFTALLGVNFRF